MLPFVYNGNGDGGNGYDCERRSDRYRRSGSRSRSRDRSRSRSWSRDRRRRSHYSRSRSTEKSRSRSRGRSRSHSRSRNRSPRQIDDGRRRSVDRDRENLREFSSALPYLSSMQAQSQTDKYASHTALYGQPHYKIVMKMLPTDSQRDALMALTARQGFRVKDIRIIHKGPDRCFGFVEFADVNSAQAWMEYNKGTLLLDDGRPIKLEYSRYDSLDGRSSGPAGSGDWMCAKCTIKNFKNRGACFKCNLTRMESDGLTRKGYAAIGVAKCDTLLLREIPLNCTETKIQAEMNRISSLDVLRVHIAESGLYAYVQMRSADDAERLMLTFNKIPLLIDGCTVMVTYSRLPLNTVLSTTAATESMQKTAERISQMPAFRPTAGPSGNAGVEAAQLALAKAQLIRQMANSLIAGDAVPPSYPANAPIPPMLNRPPPPLPLETNFVVTDYFKDDPPSERNFVCVDDITNQDSQTPSLGGIQTLPPSYSGPEIKGAADLGFVDTPWGRYKRYRAPNPTLYQFEPSSGLYYDPSTGLYYDSNSQYYWDANAQKWNCWNAMYQTYVPCDMMSRQSSVSQEVVTNNGEQNQADEQKSEVVKEEPKKEPQKTAKDIAREMARWAKKQSKVLLAVKAPPKLETTSPLVTAAKSKTSTTEPTADITYKMLGKTSNPFGSLSDDEDEEEIPPAAKIAAVGASRVALNSKSGSRLPPPTVVDSSDVPTIKTSQSDENFVDLEKKYCILCKRKFASLEILLKHVRLSDLHKKNLEAHLMQTSLSDAAALSLPSTSTSQDPSYTPIPQHYRDRAKERRNLFGLDPSGFTSEAVEVEVDYAVRTSDTPIDETNIGNKLLKSMGWQEGTGIGKNNQGILTPIATELRVEGAGLGAASSRMLHGANASRRERARSSMMSRFQELQ